MNDKCKLQNDVNRVWGMSNVVTYSQIKDTQRTHASFQSSPDRFQQSLYFFRSGVVNTLTDLAITLL